ncbi:MAG TPA: DinB family protein [Nitrolancea sp.]|jgi:hypothetical protein|nr:DinB family protein [Nitrolancea sp.]
MMPLPIVEQLRFARSEFQRSLAGITNEEACKRFLPMNSISWMIGHMAWQEQRYFVTLGQGKVVVPRVNELTANGQPASTPPLADMWADWEEVTRTGDSFLDSLTSDRLTEHFMMNGKQVPENIGTRILRTTYHYWFHNGEAQAVRQLLGHSDLPEFVGDIGGEAPYRPAV